MFGGDNVMEVQLFLLVLELYFAVVGHAVHPGCECLVFSSTYGKEKGTFKSPDFPRAYPANIDCLLYTFIGNQDEIIEINFLDFDVRKTNLDCIRGDYLKLFLHLEGGEVNEYTPWEALLCGNLADVPTVLYSSGPGLVLEFHSEPRTVNATGFSGTFRFLDRRLFKTDGQKVMGTMCDYQFGNSEYTPGYGKFYSPRYPSSYPKNIRCSYRFRARTRERIRVVFEEVSLQKGDLSCINRADIIRVYDGKSSSDPAITVLCNEGAELEILSTGQELFIEFVANSDWPGQGFKASYQFQPDEDNSLESDRYKNSGSHSYPTVIGPNVSETRSSCDAVFNSDVSKNGTISSPSYPAPYPSRTTCRTSACTIRTRIPRNFGIKTGTQLPEYPCAFVFSSNESRSGFFYSPNYPGFYPRDTECHYFFYGNQHGKVHLHFSYFDVEGVLPCEAVSASDYVEFSNFMSRDRKYSRHCGQLKEFDIESDRKFFRVTFRSNDRLDGTGFNATYIFLDVEENYTSPRDVAVAASAFIGEVPAAN